MWRTVTWRNNDPFQLTRSNAELPAGVAILNQTPKKYCPRIPITILISNFSIYPPPPPRTPKKQLQMTLGWVFKNTAYRVDIRCRILSINRMDGHPIILTGQSAFFIGPVCGSFLPLVGTQNSWYKNPHILSCLILALLSTTGKTSLKYTKYCLFLATADTNGLVDFGILRVPRP